MLEVAKELDGGRWGNLRVKLKWSAQTELTSDAN